MTGVDNVYKYITTGRKIVGEEMQEKSFYEYLQKSTGVFNKNGIIDKEEVKKMKARLQDGQKNIWHGFISFDEEDSYKVKEIRRCVYLLKTNFDDFFTDAGFEKDNMDLMCALHLDKPKHLHIHFIFWEKEPKVKNKRAKGYLYRAKGKLPIEAIQKMKDRLNNFEVPDELKGKDETIETGFKDRQEDWKSFFRDKVKKEIRELAEEIPHTYQYDYGANKIKEYRDKIDEIVEQILNIDDSAKTKYKELVEKIQIKNIELNPIKTKRYKGTEEWDNRLINGEVALLFSKNIQEIKTIKTLEWSYKRALGNIVLDQVYKVKLETYDYDKKKKHKANDKKLKRGISISEAIIKRSFTSFFNSVIDLFAQENTTHNNRLQEIEEEMKQEYQKEQEQIGKEEYEMEYRRWLRNQNSK